MTVQRPFESRDEIVAAGFQPGWHGEPVRVGDEVVVYARGGWRRATATKVTSLYVYAEVTTPTSPDLTTVGKGRRDGRRTDLYVPAPRVSRVERPSERLAADRAKVAAEVERVIGGRIVEMRASLRDPGTGIVLVRRDQEPHPFVTWQWATLLTDGSPVQSETGAMLFSGHYIQTLEEAVDDFGQRSIR